MWLHGPPNKKTLRSTFSYPCLMKCTNYSGYRLQRVRLLWASGYEEQSEKNTSDWYHCTTYKEHIFINIIARWKWSCFLYLFRPGYPIPPLLLSFEKQGQETTKYLLSTAWRWPVAVRRCWSCTLGEGTDWSRRGIRDQWLHPGAKSLKPTGK